LILWITWIEQFEDNPEDKGQFSAQSPLTNAEDLRSNWKPRDGIMSQRRETTVLQKATSQGKELLLRL